MQLSGKEEQITKELNLDLVKVQKELEITKNLLQQHGTQLNFLRTKLKEMEAVGPQVILMVAARV